MRQDYSEVIERLQTYRQAQRKTQEEMSTEMGVTQGYYAKLESGEHIISYDCLRTFEENGGDVHFLITGQRLEPVVLDDYMEACETREGRREMFRFILSVLHLGLGMMRDGFFVEREDIYKNLRFMQMELDKPGNIWKNIRRMDDITQLQMADILGINIKRYMRLEKEITKPNADILQRLYCNLSYVPMLMIRPLSYHLKECGAVWSIFPKELKSRLEPMLAQTAELIRENEK